MPLLSLSLGLIVQFIGFYFALVRWQRAGSASLKRFHLVDSVHTVCRCIAASDRAQAPKLSNKFIKLSWHLTSALATVSAHSFDLSQDVLSIHRKFCVKNQQQTCNLILFNRRKEEKCKCKHHSQNEIIQWSYLSEWSIFQLHLWTPNNWLQMNWQSSLNWNAPMTIFSDSIGRVKFSNFHAIGRVKQQKFI